MATYFCSHCGVAIKGDARQCPYCRNSLQLASKPAAQPSNASSHRQAPTDKPALSRYATNAQKQQSASMPGKGIAKASLLLGILSLFFGGPLVAILGFLIGVEARNKLETAGLPTAIASAGIVLNVIVGIFTTIMIAINMFSR